MDKNKSGKLRQSQAKATKAKHSVPSNSPKVKFLANKTSDDNSSKQVFKSNLDTKKAMKRKDHLSSSKCDQPETHLSELSEPTTSKQDESPLLGNPNKELETDVDNNDGASGSANITGQKGSMQLQTEPTDDPLAVGWEEHSDKLGVYYWHVPTGLIQRHRPSDEIIGDQLVNICQDDEEINTVKSGTLVANETDPDDNEEFDDYTAALTVDDKSECTFVVYPLGSCELDETELYSTTSTKVIQKCILRLSTKPRPEETNCWGLDQSSAIGMTLCDDHIQFSDLKSSLLIRSQPIHTFKAWAVDDDNKFAFVIEDRPFDPNYAQCSSDPSSSLAPEPVHMCYVFHSIDDDDMNCEVASKLNEVITRYRQFMNERLERSKRIQQMVAQDELAAAKHKPKQAAAHSANSRLVDNGGGGGAAGDDDDDDGDALDDEDPAVNTDELTMNVKYIGQTSVSKATGIDVLNIAIDRCLADAIKKSRRQASSANETIATHEAEPKVGHVLVSSNSSMSILQHKSPLIEAKLHISPSSVIVEDDQTGEIIVECRIRYLTFIGISKRDIRWCGFIMQSTSKSKTFTAHAFECHPTAAQVCEAIQRSCMKMYEKVVKNSRQNHHEPEAMSIIPSRSSLRSTLAKTFSRIRLTTSTSIRY